MAKEHDVLIYMRDISLDVVIPKDHVWEFMAEFGKAFAVQDDVLPQSVKAVDGYYDHPNGWHIQVTVWEHKEEAFYAFLREFCGKRGLKFRDPTLGEEEVLEVDHTRGLCGQPDIATSGISREEAEANPPNCRCCGSKMVVDDCNSAGMNQLGMYWLICPVCSEQKEQRTAEES